MQIKYSPDADVLMVRLREGKLVDSVDIAEGLIAIMQRTAACLK